MALSGVTKSNGTLKSSFAILFFLALVAQAKELTNAFAKIQAELPTEQCRNRLKELSEFRLLFALPAYRSLVETGKISAEFRAGLSTWSSDLLLKAALQLESEFLSTCQSSKLQLTLAELQRAYLQKLGLTEKDIPKGDLSMYFRACLAVKADHAALKTRVSELKAKRVPQSKFLEKLYGSFLFEHGVAVVARPGFAVSKLRDLVRENCRAMPCPFWSSVALSKVVISDERGLAAFLPEVATLVLSEELILEPNLLMKVVVLHELAHVAEKVFWKRDRKDLKLDFSKFSGWEQQPSGGWRVSVKKLADNRQDILSELSKGSLYSLLPDAVYAGNGSLDGFVTGKSYTASIQREDPSEDLADAVAIFKYVPSRFCWKGKPLAAKKYEWVRQTFFSNAGPLECG